MTGATRTSSTFRNAREGSHPPSCSPVPWLTCVCALPPCGRLLPKTSLHAGHCRLGGAAGLASGVGDSSQFEKLSERHSERLAPEHSERLARAIEAMTRHPAYRRRDGHDHVALSNYWDAWGAYGPRGSTTHAALANVSFGWHETQDAAWGMANHRHVGKCQIALPYVENYACARRGAAALLAAPRATPLYFAGAVDDFDTEGANHATGATAGRAVCPNVATHAIAARRALIALPIESAVLQRMAHNLRGCNSSAACERERKLTAARHYASSQVCAIAAGDTPSTGRLYDAIACLCVPMITVDHLQLPFPNVPEAPRPGGMDYGVRVAATALVNASSRMAAVGEAMARAASPELKRALSKTRETLAYRRADSRIAGMALRELWESCVQRRESSARPVTAVAKC